MTTINTARPMTAKQYRAHAAKVKAKAPTETVTLSSGSTWELRRPDLQGYVLTGRIPQSLLNEGVAAWKKQGKVPTTDETRVKMEDVTDSLIFMREIVSGCTVSPRFVQFATNDNEIGADDMLPADFSEIFQWAMQGQGVTGPDGLRQFRGGQERGTSTISADSQEQRDEAEPVVAVESALQ